MGPKTPMPEGDLFRQPLREQINLKHPPRVKPGPHRHYDDKVRAALITNRRPVTEFAVSG
jgi:hypothetical protein